MSFGPAWQDNTARPNASGATETGASAERANEVARQAAEKLLSALTEGERVTDGWKNAALSEAWVDTAMSECLSELATLGLWGKDNQVPSDAFWKVAGDVLSVGRLQHRARTKPLGYAGDHQMLAWICDEAVSDDPLGRHFDRFFLKQAAPTSVKNRTEQIAGAIARHCLATERRPYRIVTIGAGPGLDIRGAAALTPEERRQDLDVTLLDLDSRGLDFANEQITSVLDEAQVTSIRENLFRLPKRSSVLPHEGETDFLICTGLFDYLDEDAAAAMLSTFWQQLAPGGTLVVGNFAPHCSTRAYMEWIGNWYLTYRNATQMANLAEAADLPAASWSVGAERSGTNLFLSATKA